jgi:hypothetical protein
MKAKSLTFLLLMVAGMLLAQNAPVDPSLYSNSQSLPGTDAVILYNPCPEFVLQSSDSRPAVNDETLRQATSSRALVAYSVKKNWFSAWEVGATVLPIPPQRKGSNILRSLLTYLEEEQIIKDVNRPGNQVVILSVLPVAETFFYSTDQPGWFVDD